jgi:hypothetical protein
MAAQMEWRMTAFAIFYLMLAALAVVVWVQLHWDNLRMPALKSSPRRRGRRPEANAQNDLRPGHRPSRRPPAG